MFFQGGAAAGATLNTLEQTADIASYTYSSKETGKPANQFDVTQLAVTTVASGGFVWIGSLILPKLGSLFKTIWNSPTAYNPTSVRIVQPRISEDLRSLIGSLADSTGSNIIVHAGGRYRTPSGEYVDIPGAGTLSVDNAIEWLESIGGRIPRLLNKDAGSREQAFQAAKMAMEFKIASRNAMQDANAAMQLNVTDPLKMHANYIDELEGQFGGNALNDRVIQASVLSTQKNPVKPNIDPSCFVAGTLVHTKEGLVPIEQIKVGDWVLSKPENGEGGQTYKRVTQTFVHEDKEVFLLTYSKVQGDPRSKDCKEWEGQLIVTREHPFFVKGKGWKEVFYLEDNDTFEMSDGSEDVSFWKNEILRVTETNNVAWVLFEDSDEGRPVDFRTYPYVLGTEVDLDNYELIYDAWTFRQVFNIEVEDYHTYYTSPGHACGFFK